MLPSPLSIHIGFEKQQQANIDFTIDWSIIKESPYKGGSSSSTDETIRLNKRSESVIANCRPENKYYACSQSQAVFLRSPSLYIYIYIPNIATNRRNPFMIIFLIVIKLKNYDYYLKLPLYSRLKKQVINLASE